ncbi:MAG TPA: hypothetical protein VH643_34465 [Gemmataceae bacterium]
MVFKTDEMEPVDGQRRGVTVHIRERFHWRPRRWEEVKVTDKRPTDAIRYLKQAAGKVAEAAQKLKHALDSLRGRNPEAAQKMKDLIDSLEKPQKEIDEIDRLLEHGNAP